MKLTRSFTWLNATQFFGALNDNLIKLLIIFYLISVHGPQSATSVGARVGVLFVVPFLLFSPLAGMIADRLSKKLIITCLKISELAIVLLGLLSFSLGNEAGLYLVLFLMSTQSAIFGPSKYGIIPELVGREQLSKANSLIETFTYMAIILGSAFAPALVQLTSASYQAAAMACIFVSLAGLVASFGITKTTPAIRTEKGSIFEGYLDAATIVRRDGYLLLAILGSAYFLFIGAFAQINLIPFGIEVHGLTQEQSGYLFLLAALGIGLGSYAAGRLSGRNVEFGIVPLGALGLSISVSGLYFAPTNLFIHGILVVLMGISSGLFSVPLHAFIQFRAPADKLGRILAINTFISWCGVLAASALTFVLSGPFGLSPDQGFLVLGVMTLGLTAISLYVLPDFLLRFVALLTMRLGYRLDIRGEGNVPTEGPALLVANHVSWVDALLLLATQQRRIRFIMHCDVYNVRLLRPLFKLMQVIPVYPTGTRKQMFGFVKESRKALEDGYLVCIFAEGMITRNGMLQPFKSGMETIVKGTEYPIIPIYIGGAWGSFFSYAHGKSISNLITSFPYPISIEFGTPLPTQSSAHDVQQSVAELTYSYFERQKAKRTSLAHMFVKTARKNIFRKAISDSTGKQLSYGQALAGALALKEKLEPQIGANNKVGLLVPPSVGGTIANLSVSLLRKVPVNLNYTASVEALQVALDQCKIKTLITSKKFIEKFPDIPLPEKVIYLEEIMAEITKQEQIKHLLRGVFLPYGMISRGPKHCGDKLATVIFSSGSTGTPKGVLLTQHNIISNLEAIRTVSAISPEDNVCSALPYFHALGFTATFWLPLLSGFSACYHVNPMDAAAITKLVKKNKSTLMLTTPTFLSAYMRRAKPEDFSTLRLVVTGAEKLKTQIADSFEEKYGLRPLEGYGATELAPLITLSLPNIKDKGVNQRGHKAGSVGRAVPGVVIQVVDPSTQEPIPPDEDGLLLIKGPNLMKGYLNQPEKTSEAIIAGRYVSGDIGHVDQEGFVFITDRLARFSKIGGEMVPLGKVEEVYYEALSLEGNTLIVTAVEDEKKGEKLIVLYTEEAGDKESLHEAIQGSSLPNLWQPNLKNYHQIEALPLLGSGKLDLRRIKTLAESLCA